MLCKLCKGIINPGEPVHSVWDVESGGTVRHGGYIHYFYTTCEYEVMRIEKGDREFLKQCGIDE